MSSGEEVGAPSEKTLQGVMDEAKLQRSHQQGVVRGHINKITRILLDDDVRDVRACEDQLKKLRQAKEQFAVIHEQFLNICATAKEVPSEQIDKAEELRLDAARVDGEASGWILTMSQQSAKPKETSSPMESTTVSGGMPRMSAQGYGAADFTFISHGDENERIMREYENKMDAMKAKIQSLEITRQELEGFRSENQHLRITLDNNTARGRDESSQMQATIADLQQRLHDQSRDVSGDPGRNMGPNLNRSSFGQEELCAVGQIVSQSNMDMMKELLDHSMVQQKAFCNNMRAPQVQMIKFSGDPIDYHKFINRFDELVGHGEDSDSVKLTTLLSHCDESVHRHLDCCNYKCAEEGYQLARLILRTKFGNPYVIAQAWVERLSDYPKLNSPELLEKFSGEIKSAMDSLTSLGFLSELECTKSLTIITAKLPIYLQNKWRSIYRENMQKGCIAKLRELVKVISDAADEANDPVYGQANILKVATAMEAKHKGTVVPRKKTSYHVEEPILEILDEDIDYLNTDPRDDKARREVYAQREKTEPGTCFICKGAHYTSNCFVFLDMSSQERLKYVIEHKLCILCLGAGHRVEACIKTWVCRRPGCQMKHNGNLHQALTSRGPNSVRVNELVLETVEPTGQPRESGSVSQRVLESNVINTRLPHRSRVKYVNLTGYKLEFDYTLPVVPIIMCSETGYVRTNALFDTGSTATICTGRVQEMLRYKAIATQTVLVKGIAGEKKVTSDVVDIRLKGIGSVDYLDAMEVTFLDDLEIAEGHVEKLRHLETWSHLRDLKIPQHEFYTQVDVLIGQDNAHLFKQGDMLDGGDMYAPYAVLTPLGWTIHGHYNHEMVEVNFSTGETSVCNGMRKAEVVGCDRSLEKSIERQWKIDEVPDVVPCSPINKRILTLWEKGIKLVDGHWQIPVPYKREPPFLKDNYEVVKKKLDQLGRRLEKKPDIKEQYIKSMRENFAQGYAREASAVAYPGYEYYHPHQEVITPRRPGKCRIVGNLSFICYGESLNSAVYQGPDLTTPLIEVLVQFRLYRYAFTTDVAAMYNQVKVSDRHADSLRFLWWKDDEIGGEVIPCQMTTHMFGGVWCPSSASFALQHTARTHREEYDEVTIRTILKNFYVDDLLKSIMSVSVGLRLINQLREVLGRAGFSLAKFGANDMALLADVPKELLAKAYEEVEMELTDDVQDKTLGTKWGPKRDVFGFNSIAEEKPCTRRGILSTFSSVYDPLGFAAPFVLCARQLIQELCAESYSWDEELPQSYQERWRDWLRELVHLATFEIPRWLGITEENRERLQIHSFSDASERGYGVVLYLCILDDQGQVAQANLLMAKARVSPIKPLSIPRLELVAAVLAAKMVRSVTKMIDERLKPPVFWIDSTIVLYYIRQQAREFRTFVANRVSYVHDVSEPEQWRHVPGELNVADRASRGTTARELIGDPEWLRGPAFLYKEEDWPKQPGDLKPDEVEVRKRTIGALQVWSVKTLREEVSGFQAMLERISEWVLLVRAVGYLLRFAKICKQESKIFGKLSAVEFEAAELAVIRMTQRLFLTQSQLDSGAFQRLFPFDDQGVMRVGGRLMLSQLRFEEKHPAILPRSTSAELYIRYIHVRYGNVGVERTFVEVRRRYWLLDGKALVKKIVHRCLGCIWIRGRPGQQLMSPLPAFRVTPGKMPFENVGIDYAGPIYVKVGRATCKRWICVITCFAIRAVHLELACELSTSSFLCALQRFISRRGKPTLIVSDNGSNFVGAVREMKQALSAWNQSKIQSWMMEEGITWQFNTPTASHHGGAWERLIRTYRELTMAIAGQQTLTDESASTFLCNVEQIMNSRPLCRVSDDSQDELPITPNHLLMVPRTVNLPGIYTKRDGIQRRWKQTEYMADLFWKKWVASYLRALQERKKWIKEQRSFGVGDLVLVITEGTPRLKWPLGLVVEVFPGKDGQIRSVRVKTQEGVYERPISKLVRLECDVG